MKSQNPHLPSKITGKNMRLLTIILLTFLLHSGLVLAATITVDATDGLVADDGACSLIEAVNAANDDLASGVMAGECVAGENGQDTIVLTTDVTISTATVFDNSTGNTALPIINSAIIIDGNGHTLQRDEGLACNADAILDATEFRLIEIESGADLDLINIVLANGCLYSESFGRRFNGGAVLNNGDLSIEDSVIQNNQAHRGGGISNEGTVSQIVNSVVSNNQAFSSGGFITNRSGGTIDLIQNSVFDNNSTIETGGSVIANDGNIQKITQSTFTANRSDSGGSAAVIDNEGSLVTLENSTFSENVGSAGTGTVLFQASFAAPITINNCTFSANEADYGGIIFSRSDVVLNNSIFHNHVGVQDCTIQGGNVTGNDNISTQNNSSCQVLIATNLNPNTVGSLQDNGCVEALADGTCVNIHALLPGSEALNGAISGTTIDQRGFAVDDGMRDIGAFEGRFEEIDLIFKAGFE